MANEENEGKKERVVHTGCLAAHFIELRNEGLGIEEAAEKAEQLCRQEGKLKGKSNIFAEARRLGMVFKCDERTSKPRLKPLRGDGKEVEGSLGKKAEEKGSGELEEGEA